MSTELNEQHKDIVVITGASGLIGKRVVERLQADYTLIGLDLTSSDDENLPVHHIGTDLTDDENVRSSFTEIHETYGSRIASVIHLAAYYDFSGEPSPLYEKLTVEGTRRILHVLKDMNFDVEQFVFSSSLLVMEPNNDGSTMTEESPTRAEWAYPESKLAAERVIREEHGEIPAVILRIAGVYDDECHSLPLSRQIQRVYEGALESYVYPGDEEKGQALVHLDDLARCFEQVVKHRSDLTQEEIFLIAESNVVSYGRLQDEFGELIHGDDWTTIRVPKPVAKAGAYVQSQLAHEDEQPFIKPWMVDLADDHYAPDISKAADKLKWKPDHRLLSTAPRMVKSLLRDPHAFYERHNLSKPETFPQEHITHQIM